MKKVLLLSAIGLLAVSATMAILPGSEQRATLVAAAKSTGRVIELNNDSKYRPGIKVKKLTILDFNATWCGPCKQFKPAFEEAAQKFGTKVDFVSIDVDKNPKTAEAFGVSSIPTVIFLYPQPNGTMKRYVGTGELLPSATFQSLVKKAMK